MKKILFIIAICILSISLVSAEEVKKEEPAKESKSNEQYIKDLSSEDENLIIKAAENLGEKQEKKAVTQLTSLLKSDKRVKVRLYAAIALGQIGDVEAIETLNESLVGDQSADVRYSVLLAIHRIDPSKSIDALKKLRETETDPIIVDYLDKMEAKIRGE